MGKTEDDTQWFGFLTALLGLWKIQACKSKGANKKESREILVESSLHDYNYIVVSSSNTVRNVYMVSF